MESIKGFAKGLPAKQLREDLQKADKDFLEALVFNEYYNDFCREYADIKDNALDKGIIENDKRILYLGWWWRYVDFFSGWIPIGFHRDDEGTYVGVMTNSKWDHNERNLTDQEVDQLMAYLDAAILASMLVGSVNDILNATYQKLHELHTWMQTLKLESIERS